MVPWLPLYRVRGHGIYNVVGSPDRRVVSLREGLANLACKLLRLEVHIRAWLSSWSCGYVAVWCGMVLLCWPWQHCRHAGGSPTVLCDVVFIVAFVVVFGFPGASYKSW